jgi:hypothetical protein
VLLLVFLALAWVTSILQFVFPVGPDAAGWSLWGRNYIQWRDTQFTLTALLFIGLLLHVMLHWSWVCGIISTKVLRQSEKIDEGLQTIYGVAVLIGVLCVLSLGLIVALFTVEKPGL